MILNLMSSNMATTQTANAATEPEFENHLREKRQAAGLTQQQLAAMTGITRQAVAAVETGQYSPATSVALQLAQALHCRVEDLFSIKNRDVTIEGKLLGALPKGGGILRAQLTQVGGRCLVRPLDGAGELKSLTASADGLIVGTTVEGDRVRVKLLKDPEKINRQVAIGGCDPAMFLAAEHLRKYQTDPLLPCVMGNSAALAALKRGEVHVAGVHLTNDRSEDWNRADLKSHRDELDCIVVTFAHWEEGIIVRQGNPKHLRGVADLSRPKLRLINRERGSGARRLLDRELHSAGVPSARVRGYGDEALSHLEVAGRVKSGLADAGVGVRAAATICGLGFIPLQRERYDLVIPRAHYQSLPAVRNLLDLIVGRAFRSELEALGGYDTRETGRILELRR